MGRNGWGVRRLLVAGVLISLLCGCHRQKRPVGPLPSEAFVWQRVWAPAVSQAVRESNWLNGLHLLAAEVSFRETQLHVREIEPDWSSLRSTHKPVGLVVRIHASAASTGWDDRALEDLRTVLTKQCQRFTDERVSIREAILDYDCPSARLVDYTRLLRRLKPLFPKLGICITALPSWLELKSARELLEESPGYVLQVHSLHLPSDNDSMMSLMDVGEAKRAVTRAGNIGVPFRVALATYSCVVLFDESGRVKEVYGEDAPSSLTLSGERRAILDSDAFATAALVKEWNANPPVAMQALVWYRLPVAGDRLNWPAELLPKVATGADLKREWIGSLQSQPEGYANIVLNQSGEAPDDLPREILVEWQDGMVLAADGLQGYKVISQSAGQLRLGLVHPERFARVASGQSRVAGWLRFENATNHARVICMR